VKHSSINCFSLPKKKLTTKDQETIFLRRDLLRIQKAEKTCPEPSKGRGHEHRCWPLQVPCCYCFGQTPGNYKVTQYGNIWCCRPQTSVFLLGSCLGCGTSNIFPDRSTVARTSKSELIKTHEGKETTANRKHSLRRHQSGLPKNGINGHCSPQPVASPG